MSVCQQLELIEKKINHVILGDCLEEMQKMESNSISAIVTDPPYGLGFMGKKWDAGVPHHEIWKEALRICKPGAFLLAFGGTRTYHRLTGAIEDAGWEIRDCIMWVYGQGFPKSHNHYGLDGYGTALKPAYEPIIMAMKPCEGTFKQNAEKWGQAGINIDECRIESDSNNNRPTGKRQTCFQGLNFYKGIENKGRWPANIIFDEEAAEMLDEQSGQLKTGSGNRRPNGGGEMFNGFSPMNAEFPSSTGGASRFFYCAKASTCERGQANKHPTVKPFKLMEYLIKLIAPPQDALILDPFAGSGTTLLAAQNLGIKAIGIEKENEYVEIAKARLA